MSYGFVYLLSNAGMPGIYKIGMTDRAPMQRVEELSRSTSVPFDFTLVCYAEVYGAAEIEKGLHLAFGDFRINQGREFFRLDYALLSEVIAEMESHATNFCQCDYGFEVQRTAREENKWGKINHFFSQEADPFEAPASRRGFE